MGSPPRMRERPDIAFMQYKFDGITPAYAGKTRRNSICYVLTRDHPRVCGKDITNWIDIYSREGSPPRMRERLERIKMDIQTVGITPAYAGKTFA